MVYKYWRFTVRCNPPDNAGGYIDREIGIHQASEAIAWEITGLLPDRISQKNFEKAYDGFCNGASVMLGTLDIGDTITYGYTTVTRTA